MTVSFLRRPLPPFRLDLTVWVLRRLPVNAVDRFDGEAYRRVLALSDSAVEVTVVQTGPPETPELRVTAEAELAADVVAPVVAATLGRTLGLDVDLSGFHRMAASDPQLAALVDRFLGFKPPRLPSVFETVLNGIACQHVSLNVGLQLLNRLSAAYGLPAGDQRAFPRPEDLVGATHDDLRALGFSGRKSDNILAVSSAIVGGRLNLEALDDLNDGSVVASLLEIPGIGRWTAEYVALRGLGRLNAFPADDVGSQNKLQRWLGLAERPNCDGMHRILDKWAPYRGLIYFYLLLDSQERQGYL